MRTGPRNRQGEAGVTLLEAMIAMVLSAVAFGIYATSVADAIELTAFSVGTADLHEIGRLTIDRMRRDISETGYFVDPEFDIQFPHIYNNGLPDQQLAEWFEHDVEALTARAQAFPPGPLAPGGGSNPPPFVAPGFELTPLAIKEMVFRLPNDEDHDGRILSAVDQTVEWGSVVIGYILVPNNHGTLDLIRRRVDATGTIRDETICRHVEALTFDTVDTKPILPKDAIEIHLHLRRPDARAHEQHLHLATTVVMRNTP